MYGYTIQDWITIRGATTIQQINMAEPDWVGFSAFEDIVFWLDVREVTIPLSAGTVNVGYQTAPAKDEILFVNMATPVAISAALATPSITKVLLSQNPTVPLARWVRWQLNTSGTPTQTWDITFRILAAANAISMPTQ